MVATTQYKRPRFHDEKYTTQPCRYTKRTLSAAITKMRKAITSGHFAAPNKMALGEILMRHGEAVPKTMVARKKVWKQLRDELHPPVGKMSFADMQAYIYHTAQHLELDWSTVLNQKRQRTRTLTDECEASDIAMPGVPNKAVWPNRNSAPVEQAVSKKKPAAKKRAPVHDDTSDEETVTQMMQRTEPARTKPAAAAAAKKPARTFRKASGNDLFAAAPQMTPYRAFVSRTLQELKRKNLKASAANKMSQQQMMREVNRLWKSREGEGEQSELRERTLTASQQRALDAYDPPRNKTRLKAAVKLNMLQGQSFAAAKRNAESRARGEVAPRARPKVTTSRLRGDFLDDQAAAGK